MKSRLDILLLSTLCAVICSVGSPIHASHLPNHYGNTRNHLGQHKGHGHADLGKKDELETELLRLKEDKTEASLGDISRGGQPEYTNEDLEEELTEVRPLDIPLHLLELETVDDLEHQRYATSTMRTFGELDMEGLTTTASRIIELQLLDDLKDESDLEGWDQEDDVDYARTEEGEQSGDGSNLAPPGGSTTEQYSDFEKKDKSKTDGYDDDSDEGDDDDEEDDNDEDEDGDDDESDDDEDEDTNDEDGDEDDDDEDETTTVSQAKDKRTRGKKTESRSSRDFEESVEHGRQWREEATEENSEEASSSVDDPQAVTTVRIPQSARSALQRDFAAFLRDGSPEAEDAAEGQNSNSSSEESRDSSKLHHEAELDTDGRLEQVRELQKKANIPQQLVDSVSPKADEDLLELMVRIAEDPSEWQRVHRVLQQLDHDLVTSRKSLAEMKSLEKSNHRAEKKKAAGEWDAVSTLGNKTKATKEHRKHQQAEKKKKKKKKQRQKEKLKIKEEKNTEKLKVKGKEEIRREELEKAGVLAPTNALFKGNEEGKTSKISKESSPVKSYWTKSSKNSSQPKIKGNSLHELDSPSDREKSQSDPSTPESKGGEDKDWPNRKFQKEGIDHMSSIDSAIAYLSEPKQSIEVDTMKTFGKSNNIPQGNERTLSPLETIKSRESWPKPPVPWHHNRQNLFGSVSTSKIEGNNEHKHNRKQDVWAKHLADPETNFREVESNDLLRMSQLSQPLEKNIPSSKTYDWKPSRPEVNNWTSLKSMNPKEERRYYSGEPVYNSPNTGWPRFSVESLKHGNLVGNVKTWPEVPIDQSMGTNNEGYSRDRTPENWSTIPLESKQSKLKIPTTYTWPNFSDDSTNHNSIISGKVNAWSKPLDSSKQRDMVSNTWPQNLPPHQKPISAIDTAIAHHSKEASNNKQWPHFAYHRVTSSPQILAQQQKEAQQRARHRNAYIAVSVIAPPGKSKALGKSQNRTNASSHAQVKIKVEEPPVKPSASPLPDKMDQLLSMRSEKQKFPERDDLLEEELVDMAVEGQQQRAALPWSHARHLDKIQEQLKTLSAMGEKLRYHWLEKERLMQILRDGGKSGSGFFRPQRDGSTGQKTETTATTTNPPNLSITPHTTHAPPAP